MKPRLSLKKRIALTYVLLTVAVAGAFSAVTYIAVTVIEEQVIDARLAKMADRLIALHHLGAVPNAPPDVRLLVDNGIPAELRQLPAGDHELMLGGRQVHVLLRDQGDSRYAVVQEMGEIEHTELVILLALAVGFVVSVLLAAVLGVLSARRVIAPVAALAEAVGRNAGPTELPSLSAQDEIGSLARAFAKRTDKLQQFLQRERLFTGDVSHELRTPLTIVLGAAEVLATQVAQDSKEYAAAERIRRVAAEASQRVSALLLLSRAPDSLDSPRIVLNAIIESEMERCRPLLNGKPVECRLEWTERVWADVRPELAGIMIGNLLRNACQHTDQGLILVQLTAGQVVIEDTGTGIPREVRERLFERFVHGGEGAGDEGTGLGLSIVKRVVEHIGWEVRLEIPQAGGTRFVLTFPPVVATLPS
ncbi:HAMP domain-containing histidine kinase [Halomonas sp. LR3S48]|uniref:sensor histidine kinase n=1 Tax=Halomonas sp. LR3S48 TaxID=2982694 RepID=UPI0021E4DBAE|nr:HAMP domain-containing sensor histidine kinase [Halomonas sp. LR3S48]UYG04585.1 HAMP domain-containing histidine kinase [Halomonas sp. LR3S48]